MISVDDRFWNKVDKSGDCWIWNGAKRSNGYGLFWHEGAVKSAHRVAFFLVNGSVKDDEIVCHSCDNPSCVRPEHLFAGTQQDNVLDMLKKGRGRYSSRTECMNGHPWVESNLITTSNSRRCKTCWNERNRAWRLQRKEQQCSN